MGSAEWAHVVVVDVRLHGDRSVSSVTGRGGEPFGESSPHLWEGAVADGDDEGGHALPQLGDGVAPVACAVEVEVGAAEHLGLVREACTLGEGVRGTGLVELDEGLHEVVALAFAAGPLLTLELSRDGPHVAVDVDVEQRGEVNVIRKARYEIVGVGFPRVGR